MRRPDKDADGRFHFSEREYYATRQFFGIITTFNKHAGQLERRVREIPNGWRDLRMLMTVSERLLGNILKTVPVKKLKAIKKELDNMEFTVSIRNCIAPPAKTDTDGFTYVSQRALERITQRVVDFECFGCQKQGAEAKHCQLRKDIESTYNYEYPCASGKECPFAGMTYGGDYGEDDDLQFQDT